jgi:hypothetical protein
MSNNVLQYVDLICTDGKTISGLVSVHDIDLKRSSLTIDERAAVAEVASFEHVDYIFFRRFSDGRSSQVAAYVVDNSSEKLDKIALAILHRQIWLQGTAPLLYIAWPSRIDVLSCVRGPDFWDVEKGQCQFKPAESLLINVQTAADVHAELDKRARLSALRLADGTFWDDPRNSKLAKHDEAAHQSLIQAVVEADADLQGHRFPIMRRLLLLMVLIKYLEDRKVFPDNMFGRYHKGAKSFFDVLKAAKPQNVRNLLDFLERKFNGDIFSLSHSHSQALTVKSLSRFAELVESKTLNKQRYLWEQFSFEHLPVEVLSHLYQRFVQGGHGTVYTPPFLAALLLDHAMPYNELTGNERILDPACGSGIFLVGAFRRLANFWRSRNGWRCPSVETLKDILRRGIFGIELDPDAIDLTAFSLALALCDALKPDVIWKELKFDRLRDRNLFEVDFFQLVLDSIKDKPTILDEHFDIVIGNPPFESKITDSGKKVDVITKKKRGKLPDKQAAYLFFEQSLEILRPKGRVCLIQPSSFLYNRNVGDFRKYLFKHNQIYTVLDFTSIRKLYTKDPKTIAISATRTNPSCDHSIQHWTFRRTFSVHERISFELDHYDRHHVSQADAESDPFVWRVNLLGGGRLRHMSQRIRAMRTIEEFIKERKWEYGEGFIAAKTGRRLPAPFLTGIPLLPTKAFTVAGIDNSQITNVKETSFRSAYTKERYSAPLILIKEHESLPIEFLDSGVLAYGNEIIGIHSPNSHKMELIEFFEKLRSRHRVLQFFCAIHSSRYLIARQTALLKKDIESLPFPENPDELKMSFWENELVEDVLNYMVGYIKLGQKSQLLKNKATKNDLKYYSNLFCRMLGSIYQNLQAHEPIYLDTLICQLFYFGRSPKVAWLKKEEESLRSLIYVQKHESLRTVRLVRFYGDNMILIVKPDRLRYWIRSTAIRDADETLGDLRQQGY